FVLFRTDWVFRFNRYGNSYNNPALEGLAAFLCHPYMDSEALEWLADRGITALGHDLPSFENPLYYAVGGDVHPVVRQARQIAMERQPQFDRKVFQGMWLRPMESEAQAKRRYLKNLNLHPLAEAMQGRRVLTGWLAVVPVPILQDRGGVACEVFFSPDEA
ncbi:MAG: cyclase family protein, partial [Anaerolineae bacterium]